MTKRELLEYLAKVGQADSDEVSRAFGVRYQAAAMGLLRLARQNLASRVVDLRRGKRGKHVYRLSERGRARLVYLREKGEKLAQPSGGFSH
ncbi:MAG: hypothetical protein HYY64_08445 [Candidatus Rokubacteria bacterium]|nr:hypothetical protein [Candidatus Rokubacteria bacterium]MBI3029524.1 hypothetical protein [Candidatus Rokubacteria bacterium]